MFYRLPSPATLSPEERMQYRVSHVGSTYGAPEVLADGSAVFQADKGNRFCLQVFGGKALRPCKKLSGWYRSAEGRARAVEEFKQGRASHHARQVVRRAAAKQPHTLVIGAVLYTCWGYEQTNTEFYEVTAVTGSMVTLRQIASELQNTGFMSGRVSARPGQFIGEPLRRRAGADNAVRIEGGIRAWPHDGSPKSVSWYA